MKESELRQQVRAKIEAGASPQQVYDELRGVANMADEKVADAVRYVPTMERRAQYKSLHHVLMGLLIFGMAWRFASVAMDGIGMISPMIVRSGSFGVISLIALVGLFQYWRRIHIWVGLIGLFTLMSQGQNQDLRPIELVYLLAMACMAVLGLYLQRKLTPDYIILKEHYTNAAGQDRLREVVRFGD